MFRYDDVSPNYGIYLARIDWLDFGFKTRASGFEEALVS